MGYLMIVRGSNLYNVNAYIATLLGWEVVRLESLFYTASDRAARIHQAVSMAAMGKHVIVTGTLPRGADVSAVLAAKSTSTPFTVVTVVGGAHGGREAALRSWEHIPEETVIIME